MTKYKLIQHKQNKHLCLHYGGKTWSEPNRALQHLAEELNKLLAPTKEGKKVKEMEYRLVIDRDYGGHPVLTLGIGKDKKTWSEPHRAVSHLVKVVNHLLKNK